MVVYDRIFVVSKGAIKNFVYDQKSCLIIDKYSWKDTDLVCKSVF